MNRAKRFELLTHARKVCIHPNGREGCWHCGVLYALKHSVSHVVGCMLAVETAHSTSVGDSLAGPGPGVILV